VLTLVPSWAIGDDTSGLSGSGNLMGVLGRAFSRAGYGLLGAGFPLLPALAGLGAAVCFGWLPRLAAVRWGAAILGGAILVSAWAALFTPDVASRMAFLPEGAGGWVGYTLLVPMTALAGWLGAALILILF